MKIAMLHNYYQYLGGEGIATQSDIDVLRTAGHEVKLLSIHNDEIKSFNWRKKLELFFSTAWNSKQYTRLRSPLKKIQPQLLHVQNFFPLFSPSVHAAAQSLDIPSIQHLHNFRWGCLNASLLRNNNICESCVGKNPWRGVISKCYRGSLLGSLSVWQMLTFNRWRKTWEKDVDAFITPSQFAANKLVEIGIPGDRLYVKPNVTTDPIRNNNILPLPSKPTFLFIGRLSPEKGVMLLLKAWQKFNQPEWQLNILGDGPQKLELEQFASEKYLTNVNFLGYQPQEQVLESIQNATIVVVPSQWYETFGRVVIEAFSCGRTVICSDLGALPELVQDEINGLLVTYNSLDSWVERLQWAGKHSTEVEQMGHRARNTYLEKYTPAINYQQTMEIYQKVLH